MEDRVTSPACGLRLPAWGTPTPANPYAQLRRLALDVEIGFDHVPDFRDDVARGRCLKSLRYVIDHLQDWADAWDRDPERPSEKGGA